MRREQLKGHLDLLILAVLSRGSAHGYAVINALKDGSAGAFDLAEGTIYPALHRLEELRLVRSHWAEVGGRRRRVYELSGAGASALRERRQEWTRFVAGVDAIVAWAR